MSLVEVAVGILLDQHRRVLIAQRPKGKSYAGYWEFPGGKIEAGESARAALIREFREELGLDTDRENWRAFHRSARDGEIFLTFFLSRSKKVYRPQGLENQPFCWQSVAALDAALFPPPNACVIEKLQGYRWQRE